MEFRTVVSIPQPGFKIGAREEMLFVGSCFADAIGQRFADNLFPVAVNPYGTMYNPASVRHTVERWLADKTEEERSPRVIFITLGTNHVYRLKETGEIVDNCQKRPSSLFQEEQLSVDECADCLHRTVETLCRRRPDTHVVFTVSPIRYRKYGYHESQLSKATLLLAVREVERLYSKDGVAAPGGSAHSMVAYFPAYEILMDELRDYRFYAADMLHPSAQAVEYIWQLMVEHYFSDDARQFLREWAPLKAALDHRPFNADSPEYRQLVEQTLAKKEALLRKYG